MKTIKMVKQEYSSSMDEDQLFHHQRRLENALEKLRKSQDQAETIQKLQSWADTEMRQVIEEVLRSLASEPLVLRGLESAFEEEAKELLTRLEILGGDSHWHLPSPSEGHQMLERLLHWDSVIMDLSEELSDWRRNDLWLNYSQGRNRLPKSTDNPPRTNPEKQELWKELIASRRRLLNNHVDLIDCWGQSAKYWEQEASTLSYQGDCGVNLRGVENGKKYQKLAKESFKNFETKLARAEQQFSLFLSNHNRELARRKSSDGINGFPSPPISPPESIQSQKRKAEDNPTISCPTKRLRVQHAPYSTSYQPLTRRVIGKQTTKRGQRIVKVYGSHADHVLTPNNSLKPTEADKPASMVTNSGNRQFGMGNIEHASKKRPKITQSNIPKSKKSNSQRLIGRYTTERPKSTTDARATIQKRAAKASGAMNLDKILRSGRVVKPHRYALRSLGSV